MEDKVKTTKPLIQIVDENDNLIDHKRRDKVDYAKDIYRITALWVTNSKGQVLIAQRKMTKDKDPGLWGPAMAGTMDEGETYEENAYKETKEELGVTGIDLVEGPKEFVQHERRFFCQWFMAKIDEPIHFFTPQLDEVEELRWVDIDKLATDVEQNPDKYVPSMSNAVKLFKDKTL